MPRENTIEYDASISKEMTKETTYQIKNRTFIVTSVFREDGRESIGRILMRMMKDEASVQR